MDLLDHQQAFGAWDKTSSAMRKAVREWFSLYYGDAGAEADPCQRVAYTLVNKLCRGVFAEYSAASEDPFVQEVLAGLEVVRKEAMQLALTGGECYIKPCPDGKVFSFSLIPRDRVLIFSRDARGVPTDIGTAERSTRGRFTYTLLERRSVDEKGYLTIENKLFRSLSPETLGQRVSLQSHPLYAELAPIYTYPLPVGSVGVVGMKTPMVNCVDGSADGVSVFAPAVGLIRNIDRNEEQLSGEFRRGQSRVMVSKDLLDGDRGLTDDLFVGLDEDPERIGISIFAPQLRQESYLARKQAYLRDVETVIGLKRGMLSDSNLLERTATEIAASQSEHNLAMMDFQQMWEKAVRETVALCRVLAQLYGMDAGEKGEVCFDWGNGVLFDEEKTWADYMAMVDAGLVAPEVALGWRFNMPADTDEDRALIRARFMPQGNGQ